MSVDTKKPLSKAVKSTTTAKVKKTTVLDNSVVKIRLKAYYPERLEYSIREIMDAVKRTGAAVRGPIPLPRRTRHWTVLTSPHVDKDARDQLKLTQHARMLVVYVSSADTMNAIQKIELPPEVDIMIQVVDSQK